MLLPELRAQVLHANLEIARLGLAVHTFGNASGIDSNGIDGRPIIAIKPSGVPYATMRPEDLVLTDLDGSIVEGALRPSSDLDTHLLLYREFPQIGGIVHTHSEFATAWAQACRPIPCLGTTHADYFHGPVPLAAQLTASEVEDAYVRNTGAVIARLFREQHLDPVAVPGVLVAGHAPFAWGKTPADAVEHADLLEYIARLAWRTEALGAPANGLPFHVADHHYQRKHGPKATYGQTKSR
ncbi:L-ribulose-5-phosphate 4-epimerase AraD [Acidicapsa dinghuensis]|uniref:L-ribulose-5-phosphate 4-epimerase n=1 Tax=Acidicapsa dinghuensis TaxID=2218256 RepID=A0ABW1EK81_9BACT|nr:L-ribulose-5-phosphate 4-epimerase AraD [Acidicapsa dinghuensis]